MAWIKRNLYFLIGSLVALVLMGLAGFYLYSKWQLNNQMLEKLDAEYAELDRLNKLNPHPGKPPKTDNVKLAKEQQQQLKEVIQKSRQHFQRVTPIPEGPKVTPEDFSASLSRTIDQLQKDATNASVALPPKYSFSFAAQSARVSFDKDSLSPLSQQLGEVSAICEILFRAKINALDSIRRERVSRDDNQGPATDYIPEKSSTNELAVITPYEVNFRCFSAELASVLSGIASSAEGIVVRTINVKPAPAAAAAETQVTPPPIMYQYVPPPRVTARTEEGQTADFLRRYGMMPGVGGRPRPRPEVQQYVAPAPAPAKTGLPTVLDERELEVTLMLNLVKLAAPK
jgi:hypothetical protein